LIILHPPDLSETDFDMVDYKSFLTDIYTKCLNKLHQNGVLVSINTDRKSKGIYAKHIDIFNIMKNAHLTDYKILIKTLKANLFVPTFSHILCYKSQEPFFFRLFPCFNCTMTVYFKCC